MISMKTTVGLMLSNDYKDRFLGEYWQTKIRYTKLHDIIVKAEANTLDFKLDCPLWALQDQARAMGQYLHALEVRAQIEHINLKEVEV